MLYFLCFVAGIIVACFYLLGPFKTKGDIIFVHDDELTTRWMLELNVPPEDLENMKYVVFKIRKETKGYYDTKFLTTKEVQNEN